MRVTMLHTHPLEESYSAAIRDHVRSVLETEGHHVEVTKLGRGDEPGPTAADLAGVEALVLVYPAWWGGQPAPLLDWIQREIGPWIDATDGRPGPSPLASVRYLAAVTTHGSSHFVNRLQGEPGRRILERCVLPLCAPRANYRWIALYKLDQLERRELEGFVERAGREVAELTSARASA